MRILLWATTLQADILALALHLDSRKDTQLLIVAENVAAYARAAIAKFRPLSGRVLERGAADTRDAVARFAADVVVFDNHLPPIGAAVRVCSMWHGLGWKARPRADIRLFLGGITRLTGCDPRRPNPRFLAQCYAEPDLRWRVESWGLAARNCRVIGMPFSDLLRSSPYRKADLVDRYRIDIGSRKTLMLSLTWHYGRIFPGTWQPRMFGVSPFDDDLAFVEQVFARAADHGANVLFCMHDKKRFEPRYLEALHRLSQRFAHVEVRHKDEHPDSLADLIVSDAMVSNLSSFMTFFYHFGRPTVHICPAPGREIRFARTRGGAITRRPVSAQAEWMNEPQDNGGLSAFDAPSTLAAVDRALSDPHCCVERARAFIDAHVAGVDGQTCERFERALAELGASS